MKVAGFVTLLLASTTNAFVAPTSPRKAITSTLYASTTEASPFVQGPRIVRDELPIVYVYDHCPFCVRVRVALGIKNVKHQVIFLQNDDIPTPTKLIGKKIAPIFVSSWWWNRFFPSFYAIIVFIDITNIELTCSSFIACMLF